MSTRRTTPFLLVAVFAAPFVASWLLYLNPAWVPSDRANHGAIIDPAEPVNDLLRDAALPAGSEWVLLLPFETCDAVCATRLVDTRQVRLALGLDRERLSRLLLLRQPPPPALTRWLTEQHPDLRLMAGKAAYAALTRHTERLEDNGSGTYLVDPYGNLMMRHAADTPPKGLLKDLQRLMKLSKHWGTHASR